MEIKITAISTQQSGRLLDEIIMVLNSYSENYSIEGIVNFKTEKKK